MELELLFIVTLIVVCVTIFWYLEDINVKISTTQDELIYLVHEVLTNIKGKKLVLSAGELNYKSYDKFYLAMKKLLEYGAEFIIYCGPIISVADGFRDYIDDNGKIKDVGFDISTIHPVIKLKHQYNELIKLKLKGDGIDGDSHFSIL